MDQQNFQQSQIDNNQNQWIVVTSKTYKKKRINKQISSIQNVNKKKKLNHFYFNNNQQIYQLSSPPSLYSIQSQQQKYQLDHFKNNCNLKYNSNLIFIKIMTILQKVHIFHRNIQEKQNQTIIYHFIINSLGIGDFLNKMKPRLQYYFLKYSIIQQLKKIQKNIQCSQKNASFCFHLNFYDPIFAQQHYSTIKKDFEYKQKKFNISFVQDIEFSNNRFSKFHTNMNKENNKKINKDQKLPQKFIYLYYMPHCQRFLYQKVIKNYLKDIQIQKQQKQDFNDSFMPFIIIGNSINQYIQRCQSILKQQIPQIFLHIQTQKANSKVFQQKLKDYKESFNDTYLYQIKIKNTKKYQKNLIQQQKQ